MILALLSNTSDISRPLPAWAIRIAAHFRLLDVRVPRIVWGDGRTLCGLRSFCGLKGIWTRENYGYPSEEQEDQWLITWLNLEDAHPSGSSVLRLWSGRDLEWRQLMTFEMDRVIIDEWRRAYVLDSQQSGESGVGIECPWKFSVRATSGQQAKQNCCLVLCSSQAAEVDSCDQRMNNADSDVKSAYITCCLAEKITPTELAACTGRKTIYVFQVANCGHPPKRKTTARQL